MSEVTTNSDGPVGWASQESQHSQQKADRCLGQDYGTTSRKGALLDHESQQAAESAGQTEERGANDDWMNASSGEDEAEADQGCPKKEGIEEPVAAAGLGITGIE